MCRLCRTYVQPSEVIRIPRREDSKNFIKIVKEYTGQEPCIKCRTSFMRRQRKKSKNTKDNIDKYIMRKLLTSYYIKHVTKNVQYKILIAFAENRNLTKKIKSKKINNIESCGQTIFFNFTTEKFGTKMGTSSRQFIFDTYEDAFNAKINAMRTRDAIKTIKEIRK